MVTNYIYIPTNLQTHVLSKKGEIFLSIHGKSFYIGLKFYKKFVNMNRWSNSICVKSANSVKLCSLFEKFLKSWALFFIRKIKFTGKGFKIVKKKKSNFLKLFFGKSHLTIFLFRKVRILKLRKRKIIVDTVSAGDISRFIGGLVRTKYINMYTKRGLRLSRQLYYKRNSKKSAYK